MPDIQPPISAVLFDCDGVLVNSEEIALQSEIGILESIGLHYSLGEYQEIFSGVTRESMRDILRIDYAKKVGGELPDSLFIRLHDAYHAVEKDQLRHPPGLVEVLDYLVSAKVAFGIASNGAYEEIKHKLGVVGLSGRFGEHIYSKDFVALPKPAPDLYLYGMQKLGVTEAQRCLVIEDSLTGTMAGVSAGMQVIGFAFGGHRPAHHADGLRAKGASVIARSMGEVLEILRNAVPGPAVSPGMRL